MLITTPTEINLCNEKNDHPILTAIVNQLITKNLLDFQVNIGVSTGSKVLTTLDGDGVLIALPIDLLKNVQSEDELAGIIAHELALIQLKKEGIAYNKIAEMKADARAIQFVDNAGYNPNAFYDFLRRACHDNRMEGVDLSNEPQYDIKIAQLPNEFPLLATRLRFGELLIVKNIREGNLSHFNKEPTPWSQSQFISANQNAEAFNYWGPEHYTEETVAHNTSLDEIEFDDAEPDEAEFDNAELDDALDDIIRTFRKSPTTSIEQCALQIADLLGKDDGSEDYLLKAKRIIDNLAQRFDHKPADMSTLLATLAKQIHSQKELSYYIRDKINGKLEDKINPNIITQFELLMHQCDHDKDLRDVLLQFLMNPNKENKAELNKYIENNYLHWKPILGDALNEIDTLTPELKIAFVEPILFPLSLSAEKQKQQINEQLELLIPKDMKNRNVVLAVIRAYFNTMDLKESRLILAAVMVEFGKQQATKQETPSYGKLLKQLLPGPGGAKLLQAIHSTPGVDEDIKKDLKNTKSDNRPYERWEVMELIEKNGLFNITNGNPIKSVGTIAGTGSFGVTVLITFADGKEEAVTLLHPNVEKRALHDLEHMEKVILELIKDPYHDPLLDLVPPVIEGAKRSAKVEADMTLAEEQIRLGKHAYDGFQIKVDEVKFTHKVASYIDHGKGYKRCDLIPGLDFNKLPDETDEDKEHKKAVAKAMIVTQLTLWFSGVPVDLDRHGGNIKVDGTTIYHFDFGAMDLEKATKEDKEALGMLLMRVTRSMRKNKKDFKTVLTKEIKNIKESISDEQYNYLISFLKSTLALGDYLDLLKPKEIGQLLAYCMDQMSDENLKEGRKRELMNAHRSVLGYGARIGYYLGYKWYAAKDITIEPRLPAVEEKKPVPAPVPEIEKKKPKVSVGLTKEDQPTVAVTFSQKYGLFSQPVQSSIECSSDFCNDHIHRF